MKLDIKTLTERPTYGRVPAHIIQVLDALKDGITYDTQDVEALLETHRLGRYGVAARAAGYCVKMKDPRYSGGVFKLWWGTKKTIATLKRDLENKNKKRTPTYENAH